jgi:lipoprotein-releasing system permease protein
MTAGLSFKLALRGLWRHRLRSGVTLVVIAFGHFMLIVFMALSDGVHEQMIEVGLRQGTAGHVVVQARGYQQERAVELLVPAPNAVRNTIAQALPGAEVVLRVYGGGLARTAENAVGVLFAGVEPGREERVSDLPNRITRGVYLGASAEAIRRAEQRPGELWCARGDGPGVRVHPVVVGAELARTLRIGLCDKLVLDAQGLAEVESAQLRVVGLFETGQSDLDGFFLHLELPAAQRLLHLGEGVHQVAVFLESSAGAAAAAREIRARLRADLAVLPWDEAMPELAEFIWLDDASYYIFVVILFLIVGIGVLNTVLMSVMERTRELGLLRALGATPGRTFRLVLLEALLLGFLGIAVGWILALPVHHHLESTGLDLGLFVEGGFHGGGVAVSGVVRAKLHAGSAGVATLSIWGMALLSAIYPAARAARLHVLKAIHDV